MNAIGRGFVIRAQGESLVATLPAARVGTGVRVRTADGGEVTGEVAAVERSRIAIAPYASIAGVAVGDPVSIASDALEVPLGFSALGRAIDAAGRPLDGGTALDAPGVRVARDGVVPPGDRRPVARPFWTGVRAIDGLLTVGRGARVGLFGAPGAGKTTLLETIVAGASADAIVLALVGERGREARSWFARIDGRTSIVCATSDRSAAERVRAADVAMAQAQHLAARGAHVLLVVDSLARYAAALREARVALGEPVGRGGYPPSVWADLARFLERAGSVERGSITLLATVLSDGADEREPLSDAARSLLDGHVVLSSSLARAAHYPAIDVLASASRTMHDVVSADHGRAARVVRAALARLAETKDARDVGLAAADPALATLVAAGPALDAFLRQTGIADANDTIASLASIAARVDVS